MNAPFRPALRYHGGKWRIAPQIIASFPEHQIYVEPFGGAASVLLRKPRSYAEIYNDLNGEVVGLFRVLRGERSTNLIDAIRLTPFAREEFEESYASTDDPIEAARRLVVRSFMGFGADGVLATSRTGFRDGVKRSHTTPAHDWAGMPHVLAAVAARFTGVVIENRPAIEVMRKHDGSSVLHYVDPPYMPNVRSQKARRGGTLYHAYSHEMTENDHAELLDVLNGLIGAVVISGYATPLYDRILAGWRRTEHAAMADGARFRTEILWRKPAKTHGLAWF